MSIVKGQTKSVKSYQIAPTKSVLSNNIKRTPKRKDLPICWFDSYQVNQKGKGVWLNKSIKSRKPTKKNKGRKCIKSEKKG